MAHTYPAFLRQKSRYKPQNERENHAQQCLLDGYHGQHVLPPAHPADHHRSFRLPVKAVRDCPSLHEPIVEAPQRTVGNANKGANLLEGKKKETLATKEKSGCSCQRFKTSNQSLWNSIWVLYINFNTKTETIKKSLPKITQVEQRRL